MIYSCNIRFRNFAKVPSVMDSPMKGTTASTRSPTVHQNNQHHSNQKYAIKIKTPTSMQLLPLSEENVLILCWIKESVRINCVTSLQPVSEVKQNE